MDSLDGTVNRDVMTDAMVVMKLTVPVIRDVNRAGREATVKNVMEFYITLHLYVQCDFCFIGIANK